MNDFGWIVKHTWFDLINHVGNIQLHEFIIMPNHVHGIIEIVDVVGAGSKPTLIRRCFYVDGVAEYLRFC